jgi:serine/threonine-protein kinase
LVFARATTLMAQPFDLKRLDVTGEPVALLQGIRYTPNSAADFALAANGTLVYVPGGFESAAPASALVWVDRGGHVVAKAVDESIERPDDLRLSPDGRRVTVTTGEVPANDLWVYDLEGRPPIPLASGNASGIGTWSPDGKTIAFAENRGGRFGIYTAPADGSAREAQPGPPLQALPAAWTRSGEIILWRFDGSPDIVAARVDRDGEVRDVVATADSEVYPALSPDERWLAYASNRTGRNEVWVKPYPEGSAVRVSRNGGIEPVWSRDGRELFYRQETSMFAIAIDTSSGSLSFKPAVELFNEPWFWKSPTLGLRSYDVAPDGRFLMFQPLGSANGAVKQASVVVIENWIEEVKRRVPLP